MRSNTALVDFLSLGGGEPTTLTRRRQPREAEHVAEPWLDATLDLIPPWAYRDCFLFQYLCNKGRIGGKLIYSDMDCSVSASV